jgi:hypothetical protein
MITPHWVKAIVQNGAEDEGLAQTTSLVDFGLAHE